MRLQGLKAILLHKKIKKQWNKTLVFGIIIHKGRIVLETGGIKGVYVMNKGRGFTLIELLVVIAIIALLMSILMPALAKVRNQAKDVIDRANQRQFGFAYEMYTGNNNGIMPIGYANSTASKWGLVHRWPEEIWSYYGEDENLLFCPMAAKPHEFIPGPDYIFGSKFKAWGDLDQPTQTIFCGSYGLNEWTSNPAEILTSPQIGWDPKYWWKTPAIRNATNIPVLLDSGWSGLYARNYDTPPQWDGQIADHGLKWVCINRHSGHVNALFLDFTVRKVGLKQLWTYEWHRGFETANAWTILGHGGDKVSCADYWDTKAEWMKNMKEY